MRRWGRSPSSAPGNEDASGAFAAKVFETLGEHDINIEMISPPPPIRISCVSHPRRARAPTRVRALHSAFELSGPDTIRPERPFGEFQ